MAKTILQSTTISWKTVTGKIRAQAHETYCWDLNLHQQIRYVHSFLLAKAWYTAQILPPVATTQYLTCVSWCSGRDNEASDKK